MRDFRILGTPQYKNSKSHENACFMAFLTFILRGLFFKPQLLLNEPAAFFQCVWQNHQGA
jgi:hypothetical protein